MPRAPARPAALARPLRFARASHASARTPRAAALRLPHALGAPRTPACALRARPAPLSVTIQYFCIAAQFQPPQSRYKFCIVTLPSQPTACNTIFVLQHTSNSPCNTTPVAIQFCIATQTSLFLQYNPAFQPSYCNINQPTAIQKPLTSLILCNTMTVLQYNFFFFSP